MFNAINITDYNQSTGAVQYTYNKNSSNWPHGKSSGNGPDSAIFGYASGAAYANQPYGRSMNAQYYGYGKNNNGLCYTSKDIERDNAASTHLVQYHYVSNDGTTYYYYIQYSFSAMTYKNGGCFAKGTLITLADGTQKPIEEVSRDDRIRTWNFFTGQYDEKGIAILVDHGEEEYEVANLTFSNGTVLRTIADHGLFDFDANKFVYILPDNCEDFINHRFVMDNGGGGYDIVTLTDAEVTVEVTNAYSITSSENMNAFANGLLTLAPPEEFYNWIPMGETLMYDVEAFEKDVETYGLYDYETFKDYVTYEQYLAFNGAYLKIPVSKGIFSFDSIIDLIILYRDWLPMDNS